MNFHKKPSSTVSIFSKGKSRLSFTSHDARLRSSPNRNPISILGKINRNFSKSGKKISKKFKSHLNSKTSQKPKKSFKGKLFSPKNKGRGLFWRKRSNIHLRAGKRNTEYSEEHSISKTSLEMAKSQVSDFGNYRGRKPFKEERLLTLKTPKKRWKSTDREAFQNMNVEVNQLKKFLNDKRKAKSQRYDHQELEKV